MDAAHCNKSSRKRISKFLREYSLISKVSTIVIGRENAELQWIFSCIVYNIKYEDVQIFY